MAEGAKVGYLPQEPQLDPERDVRGNVEQALSHITEAQAELDSVRADHTGSQQFAMPRIRDLIQRVQEIDKELEQIDLAIEIERQLDS